MTTRAVRATRTPDRFNASSRRTGSLASAGAVRDTGTIPDAILSLQRLAGNQAVSSLLQVQRFAPGAARPGGSVDWNAPGIRFGAPAGGASGGVMKVRDQGGGLLIVKPESSSNSSPAMVSAADRVFSRGRFGVQSPNARFVVPPGEEYNQLWARMQAVAPEAEKPEFFKIMESAGTSDLREALEGGAENRGDAQSMVAFAMAFARRNDYWSLMGRVCVGDLFFNNDDRFNERKANFGNVMLNAQGQAASIDAEVQMGMIRDRQHLDNVFKGGAGAGRLGITLENIDLLFSRPQAVFENVWAAIAENLQHRGGPEAAQALGLWRGMAGRLMPPAREAFMRGVEVGKRDLRNLLKDDQVLKDLKGDFARIDKGSSGGDLGAKMDWNSLKVMRRYYLDRLDGMSREAALEDARKYGHYRLRRDERGSGLKWTARFF